MRVGILSPVWFPVPPPGYGGIELVVSLLADGLVEAGHEVTLFASGDSHTKAELSWVYERAPSELIGTTWPDLRHALACYGQADEFDVINDHSSVCALLAAGAVPTPTVQTVHAPMDGEFGAIYESVIGIQPSAGLLSVSLSQQRARPDLPWIGTVPNAIDLQVHALSASSGSYLLFLGRMSADKGCHRAIEVARAVGLPLKIAAKNREPAERRYFAEQVEPWLGGGIEYVGEPTLAEKVELLQNARALLFPIEREEPFGLVIAESLACGTPVVATRRGAVPELVENGRTGFVVESHRDMPTALSAIDQISRLECRRYAEEHFAPGRMAAGYEHAFRTVLDGCHGPVLNHELPANHAVSRGSWRHSNVGAVFRSTDG
jgi:glycosyltransferase involved in cell wall biosynthesis